MLHSQKLLYLLYLNLYNLYMQEAEIDKKLFADLCKNSSTQGPFTYDKGQLSSLKCIFCSSKLTIPIRLPGCKHIDCVYSYPCQAKSYTCQNCKSQQSIENMYVDFQLASILNQFYQAWKIKYPNLSPEQTRLQLDINSQGILKLSYKKKLKGEQIQLIVQQKPYKESLMKYQENDTESKKFVTNLFKNQSLNYFSQKKQNNELSKELHEEIARFKEKISPQVILSELRAKSNPQRNININKKLFGFYKGRIYISITGTKIEPFDIIGATVFDDFYGSAWFYAKEKIYAVGGMINDQPSKCIYEFEYQPMAKKFKSKKLKANNQLLGFINSTVSYIPELNRAYIIGGMNKQKTQVTNQILVYDLNNDLIERVCNMQKLRFNHSSVRVKNQIYIIGGFEFQSFMKYKGKAETDEPSLLSVATEKYIEVYNIESNSISCISTSHSVENRILSCRGIALYMPFQKNDAIIIFGGNHGKYVQYRSAYMLDLQNLKWVELNKNKLPNTLAVGEDKIISKQTNIVDFVGEQKENSNKFLHIIKEKATEIVLTSGEDGTFMWEY